MGFLPGLRLSSKDVRASRIEGIVSDKGDDRQGRRRSVQPMLLVIDMLVDFLDRWPPAERATLVAAIGALADAFRAAGHPVVWVRQEFAPDLADAFLEMRRDNIRITIAGTPGSRIIPELAPGPDDLHVVKKRYSAFFGTPLDEIVREKSVDTLVLAGVNTHACVRMTAIDAYQRDLAVIIARDAVGSRDREHAAVSLRYMDGKIAEVVPVADVVPRIGGAVFYDPSRRPSSLGGGP
jgi:nicotinamidase-related amidase